MFSFFNRLFVIAQNAREREEGQTLVEYALILAIVSIGTIAALAAITGKINSVFQDVINAL
jgi:Flp pilus assembly pilin Flp